MRMRRGLLRRCLEPYVKTIKAARLKNSSADEKRKEGRGGVDATYFKGLVALPQT